MFWPDLEPLPGDPDSEDSQSTKGKQLNDVLDVLRICDHQQRRA